ncbi:hypothetical protein P4O66_006577, partial [Electrophorus voltai]
HVWDSALATVACLGQCFSYRHVWGSALATVCVCVRACLGQCFSYSVPNTFPQSTESLVHCDSCMPAQTQWEVVTLECPGSTDSPRVDKLVEQILHCSCQSCSKEAGQEGPLMQLYPLEGALESPSPPDAQLQHAHTQFEAHAHTHSPEGG